MSTVKKPRAPAWHKRYPGACVRATLISPRGTVIEITTGLTDEEFKALLGVLFPSGNPLARTIEEKKK